MRSRIWSPLLSRSRLPDGFTVTDNYCWQADARNLCAPAGVPTGRWPRPAKQSRIRTSNVGRGVSAVMCNLGTSLVWQRLSTMRYRTVHAERSHRLPRYTARPSQRLPAREKKRSNDPLTGKRSDHPDLGINLDASVDDTTTQSSRGHAIGDGSE